MGDESVLNVMRKNGLALQYVDEQTPEHCLAATKQNGMDLKFVKDKIYVKRYTRPGLNKQQFII